MPRFPLIPTVLVLAAVATMIALGVWQLGRLEEKQALIARYETAENNTTPVAWPASEEQATERLYRMTQVNCTEVTARRTSAATAQDGAKGLAQIATCRLDDGGEADIALGFTRRPVEGEWEGGSVTGVIAPGPRLVATPPQAGLQPLARPDPADVPNNHLAYAGQWFFFALTALVIYILALRRQQRRD
ncbi:MAG: SURF1 family protein [Erythrobacter sp.]|jgi:surfeit locus 1 family protein|nr:SURF1 family protein [Erythrobacter sp.]